MNDCPPAFEVNGCRVIRQAADARDGARQVDSLREIVEQRGGAGVRNLLFEHVAVRELSSTLASSECLRAVLGEAAFPVRALFFDKTPAANWKVAWHQDLSVAVAERHDVPGFTGWSLKDGVWHVQPPAEVLERMVTLRLHLDDCGPDNGPLKVIPGSHREGRLSRERIEWWKSRGKIVECPVPAGGVLLMRPLLLHSSSPAREPSHRRVLHIEFAVEPLPAGLRWAVESLRAHPDSAPVSPPSPCEARAGRGVGERGKGGFVPAKGRAS